MRRYRRQAGYRPLRFCKTEMKNKGQSFGSFFLSAARVSGAILPVRLLWAVLLAGALSGFVLVVPTLVPAVAARFPNFFIESAAGATYVYSAFASIIIMFTRVFGPKLFVFDEIASGKWELASRCGANLRTPCLAKALFAFWAPISTYCIGAVVFSIVIRVLGGSLFTGFAGYIKTFAVGVLTMIVVFSIELIFASFGVQKSTLPFACLPFLILALVYWYWKGFLSVDTEGKMIVAVDEIVSFSPTGLLLIAPVLLLLALLICMTVPVKRIDKYVIEDLDDEMLRTLEFRADQEVYEKTSDGFELVFTGKEVLKSK